MMHSPRSHQRSHPSEWSPADVEATEHWIVAVDAVRADREQHPANGVPPECTLGAACAAAPALARSLALVCHHGLHGLLMQWAFSEASERLQQRAVPRFWEQYRQLVRSQASVSADDRGAVKAAQRRGVRALLDAASELLVEPLT